MIVEFLRETINGTIPLHEQCKKLATLSCSDPKKLAEIVRYLRSNADMSLAQSDAIDICGTGGSGLSRFNTSTMAAFVLATLGVKVAKHGNKSSGGRCGSFDLLEQLELPTIVDSVRSNRLLASHNLAFLYAPAYYSVMRHFGPMRKEYGKPTFFNLIGPLLSPAGVKRQIIGTSQQESMRLIAETCRELGHTHVLVVHGSDGLDEVTLTGTTHVVELKDGTIKEYSIEPKNFGISPLVFEQIAGGTPEENRTIAHSILDGATSHHTSLIAANVALALQLTDTAITLQEGYEQAMNVLSNGDMQNFFTAYKKEVAIPSILEQIRAEKKKEIAERKKAKPLGAYKTMIASERDFKKALTERRKHGFGPALIAEIKYASPSEGSIREAVQPEDHAREYEESGAQAISVLCDKRFQGDLQRLKDIAAVTTIPLLCKDFMLDPYQIYEARAYGADAILLIASLLSKEEVETMLSVAKSLNMDAICEVHTKAELDMVLETKADMIGINNRNLHTFEIDMTTTSQLARHIPEDKIIISESGIKDHIDVRLLPPNVAAVLCGTAIMRHHNPSEKIIELLQNKKHLLKICGVQTNEDATFCDNNDVDFIGLNFVSRSTRKITVETAVELRGAIHTSKVVGVFENQPIEEVCSIAEECNLDYIQLCGEENIQYIQACNRPVIKTIPLKNRHDTDEAKKIQPYVACILFDGPKPGSGVSADITFLADLDFIYMLAGGITPENAEEMISKTMPVGIDVASGVETDGQIDQGKITKLLAILSSKNNES